jgi:TolB-like protein
MGSLTEKNVRAHLERLCTSDAFRASPTLCRVLRFLVDKAFESDDTPVGQQLLAEQALGLPIDNHSTSAVAARMQIVRLRKLLADHYETAGKDEPIRIEIPKRNYRPRFRVRGVADHFTSQQTEDQASVAIVEFAGLSLDQSLEWIPLALTRELAVALEPFRMVSVVGPFPAHDVAATAAGATGFLLMGDVRTDRCNLHLTLRLLDGWSGAQIWATKSSCPLTPDGSLPGDGLRELTRAADSLADETGAITCHRMQATASQPPETLSTYEALVACWRYLLTDSTDDMRRGCQATTAAVERTPDCPSVVAAEGWMQVVTYLASPDPRQRPPRQALVNLDRAACLAPSDPLVQLFQAYAIWIFREPLGLEALCRRLDGRPTSGTFQGLLGSLLVVTGLDLDRGETLLAEAFRRVPEPLPLFAHSLAISRFRHDDFTGMGAALARSSTRTAPLPIVLRMALACSHGDTAFASRLATVAGDLIPGCSACCEVMLRRLLHDDHVDALAATLAPLNLDWFTE